MKPSAAEPGSMTYQSAVSYLDSLAQFGWKLDLARIERLCELAGRPERQFRSVLVGGSAGKGSTCAFLASILRASGVRTGEAPKPHLFTHRERVQVDGELISEARFAALMERIVPLAAQVTEEEGSPTVFEVMTLLAFLHFAESGVEWAVVEVGLGGRSDATNVLPAAVSVITMVGLDHTDRLGETVEQIAFEKAGIIKPGKPVVTGAEGAALEVIEAAARDRGCEVWRLGHEILPEHVRVSRSGTRFDLRITDAEYSGFETPLLGEHQARNAALAVAAANLAEEGCEPFLSDESVFGGVEAARIPGRLQVLSDRPYVVVDGAHSPDRAEALAATIEALYFSGKNRPRLILVLGCGGGHDSEGVVRRLAPLADQVIATRSRHPAARSREELAGLARRYAPSVREAEPVSGAFDLALAAAGPDDLVLVTGSLFVVAEALEAWWEREAEAR
jgi:dihydrofolate synthase/folylpolyglutamate synthase